MFLPNSRYPAILPYTTAAELAMVEEEFIDYQIMENSDIPDKVSDSPVIREGETKYHRMDTV